MATGESRPSVSDRPLVSIGLPVYNGMPYLPQAVDSLLRQTHRSIELIISDNASSDGSSELCARYAENDGRVRYSRLDENIGANGNHDRVRELARGQFFMFAASDDLWHPTYVERCLAILQSDPGVVLVYSVNAITNEHGDPVGEFSPLYSLDTDDPVRRFSQLVEIDEAAEPIYGLIRRSALERTAKFWSHPAADRFFLAELAMLGRFVQIPEALYTRRVHSAQASGKAFPRLRDRYAVVSPRAARRKLTFPRLEFAAIMAWTALKASPDLNTRVRCLRRVLQWCSWTRESLWKEIRSLR